jgi:CDP-6-deoxy-D-xylo-4-hexulose-3-dehydrase
LSGSSTWGAEERAAAIAVIDSGMVTMGKKTEEFEKAYAAYCGTKYCLAVNSGSSANLLMVAAYTLENGPGTVIVPAVGWATSYSPFQQYGWELVFVDIDRETLNYDIEQLWKAAMAHKDAVILAINLLGNPNEFDAFPVGVVLEDNCESMGAEYKGRKTGSFGLMASHSTYFSHHICTMEGGMVTTNDRKLYEMMLSIRSHGWTRHLPEKNVLGAKVEQFGFILPGYNIRPTEMQCAIGLEQLKKLPKFIEQRRKNAAKFPFKTQREIGKSSWFGMLVTGDDRKHFADDTSKRPVVTGNFLRQPVIKFYEYTTFGETPNADYIHDHAIMVANSHLEAAWPQPLSTSPEASLTLQPEDGSLAQYS